MCVCVFQGQCRTRRRGRSDGVTVGVGESTRCSRSHRRCRYRRRTSPHLRLLRTHTIRIFKTLHLKPRITSTTRRRRRGHINLPISPHETRLCKSSSCIITLTTTRSPFLSSLAALLPSHPLLPPHPLNMVTTAGPRATLSLFPVPTLTSTAPPSSSALLLTLITRAEALSLHLLLRLVSWRRLTLSIPASSPETLLVMSLTCLSTARLHHDRRIPRSWSLHDLGLADPRYCACSFPSAHRHFHHHVGFLKQLLGFSEFRRRPG